MINKTRIFISSAYETDLKGPRKIIKEYLEQCGHEVPIFEDGDFGTWEKDTLKQCLEVVESSDVVILLINRKSGASSRLMNGNVTPTYLEYVAARQKNKHILVFVSPNVKQKFNILKAEFDRLYEENIYVVDSYNQQVRLITFNADKQTIYVTEPVGNSVLCMHFDLTLPWSEEQVKAYESEINYAIIEQHEFFYEFLIRLLGGRT